MKEAKIKVTVQTFFDDHTYRNNTVELKIPVEAAKIISDAWTDWKNELAQHKAIRAKYLAKNQFATAILTIDGEDHGGISNMGSDDVQDDVFTRHFCDKDDE